MSLKMATCPFSVAEPYYADFKNAFLRLEDTCIIFFNVSHRAKNTHYSAYKFQIP